MPAQRDPNDTSGLIVMADGSTWKEGTIQRPDGTLAAILERQQPPPARPGQGASYDAITAEATAQRLAFRVAGPSDYRSSGQQADAARNANNGVNYGRVVQMTIGANRKSPRINAVWTPEDVEEGPWTVVVQPPIIPPIAENGASFPVFAVYIQWMVGGCTFTKTCFIKPCGVAWQLPLSARKVMVDIELINMSSLMPGAVISVNCAVAKGALNNTTERYAPSWLLTKYSGFAAVETNVAGPAVLMSAIVTLATASPVPLFPMFIDAASGLSIVGFTPFLIGNVLQNTGDYLSFDDEFTSEFYIAETLYFALSTTAFVYTAPGAIPDFVLNLKSGS